MLDLDKSTWTRMRFDDVAHNVKDRVDDPSSSGHDRYVGLEHLDAGSLSVTRWGDPSSVTATKLVFGPGDVIFGRRRAYQRKVSQAYFAGIASAHALVLRAKKDVVSERFLPVFLSSDYFLDRAISISVGSLSPTVNWRDLARQEFDLPPLDEQERIADLVWALESVRCNLDRALSAADATTSSLLHVRLEELGKADSGLLGDAIDDGSISLLTGPFGTALSAQEYRDEGVPVIHPSNIVDGRLTHRADSFVDTATWRRLARWHVEVGDIVLMRKGDVGRSAKVTQDEAGWVLGSDCILVRCKGTLYPAYVQAILGAEKNRRELLRRAPGTTMPGINEKSLRHLQLPKIATDCQLRVLDELANVQKLTDSLAEEKRQVQAIMRAVLAEVGRAA